MELKGLLNANNASTSLYYLDCFNCKSKKIKFLNAFYDSESKSVDLKLKCLDCNQQIFYRYTSLFKEASFNQEKLKCRICNENVSLGTKKYSIENKRINDLKVKVYFICENNHFLTHSIIGQEFKDDVSSTLGITIPRINKKEQILKNIKTESKIEYIFLEEYKKNNFLNGVYQIKSQVVIGPYRADFVVYTAKHKIIIECDGHDFHEKTKEQAANDKKRDRYLQTEGYVVLRFTGSEIFNNAKKCIDEVYEFIKKTNLCI